MRKAIILAIILILSITFVSAEYKPITKRITLEESQSTDFNGKRLTLLNLDFENEKVIVCVNGKKMILPLRKTKTVSGAMLELKKVTMNKAEIRVWINCPGCKCDESCDNSICFDECLTDKECDDGNDLTDDKCSGTPKRCHNDRVKECTINEHCDDMDDSTTDKCSDSFECVHTKINIQKEKKVDQITGALVIEKTSRYA